MEENKQIYRAYVFGRDSAFVYGVFLGTWKEVYDYVNREIYDSGDRALLDMYVHVIAVTEREARRLEKSGSIKEV